MSERVFIELLNESYKQEFALFDNPPVFEVSAKHKRQMNRIFRIYENNVRALRASDEPEREAIQPIRRFSLKVVLIAIVAVFLAVIAGCSIAYFTSQTFRGNVYHDFTELFPINTEGCPTTIEERYYLSAVPVGFELSETISTPFKEIYIYANSSADRTITFSQCVKSNFGTSTYNTENHKFEEVNINGKYGLYLDTSVAEYGGVIWDNGDYILEIVGDLSKTEIIILANSAEISK